MAKTPEYPGVFDGDNDFEYKLNVELLYLFLFVMLNFFVFLRGNFRELI